MARFPIRESDLIALAHPMIAGFTTHPDIFIHPPCPATQLQGLLADFLTDHDETNLADTCAIEAHAKKTDSQEKLAAGMTTLLRHAESIVASPEQLDLIGGSSRSSPAALQAPGQCRALEAVRQGSGWVFLDWNEPAAAANPPPIKSSAVNSPAATGYRSAPPSTPNSPSPPNPPANHWNLLVPTRRVGTQCWRAAA
ncbi:MAG: hypothetical protein PHE55_22360 [Methylococcaceae bacterium]|nr:hypothetical protein [Methylococcaceae bacterium]